MENQFGFKDLIHFLLIALLICIVALAMVQFDRQYRAVQDIQSKLNDQTADLSRILRRLDQGKFAQATTNPTAIDPSTEADVRVRKIHEASDYAQGGQVIDLFAVIPDKLTPLISTDQYSQYVQGYVLDVLVDRDPVTLAYIPRLATKWSSSPDGLVHEFTIRKGVTFSNGEPLTADDVLFTIQLTQNEKIEAPRLRVYLDRLKKVEKVGDDVVRFTFKDPYFMAFDTAASTQVISKKFYSQFSEKQINDSTGLLLGSGPYRLPDPTSWKPEPGKPIELVRNERYWGEQSGPDRLVWRIISEPAARMTSLRNGEINCWFQPNPDQFNEIKKDPELSKQFNLYAMDTLTAGYMYVGWNQKRDGKPTPFADVRVRRAMTMLIDRERIVRDIMRGLATVCTGPFSYLSPSYDQSVKPYAYDPEAAKKLLLEAGFTVKDGTLQTPDGKPFEFEFLYNSGSEVSKRVSTFMKDSMARAGIVVHLAASEWTTILQKTKERNYDSVFMGWGGAIEDDPEQIFCSSAMQGVGDNFVQYSNTTLDAVVEKARFTPDANERLKLWRQVHHILHEDQPYTFMFADKELNVVNKSVKGVEVTKLGIAALKNEWYIPRAAQKRQ